jgi:hypothetical protein
MSRFVFKLSFTLAITSFATTAFTPAASARGEIQKPPTFVQEPSELRIAPPVLDRTAVRAALVEQRRANVARFHAYRIGGVYPSNVFTSGLANVWQDQQGHFCAAATIIRASGQIELVDRIAEDNNFFRIVDVSQGPVMDWILTSGLTKAELVMIQKPFMSVTKRPELAPTEPIAIDPRLRAVETRRLAKLYKDIEAKLAKQQRVNLELAVDRLMKRPDLARQLLGSTTSPA